jgi:hypothetical protein
MTTTNTVRFNSKNILSFLRLGEKTHNLQSCFTSCCHVLLTADILYYLWLGEKTDERKRSSSVWASDMLYYLSWYALLVWTHAHARCRSWERTQWLQTAREQCRRQAKMTTIVMDNHSGQGTQEKQCFVQVFTFFILCRSISKVRLDVSTLLLATRGA